MPSSQEEYKLRFDGIIKKFSLLNIELTKLIGAGTQPTVMPQSNTAPQVIGPHKPNTQRDAQNVAGRRLYQASEFQKNQGQPGGSLTPQRPREQLPLFHAHWHGMFPSVTVGSSVIQSKGWWPAPTDQPVSQNSDSELVQSRLIFIPEKPEGKKPRGSRNQRAAKNNRPKAKRHKPNTDSHRVSQREKQISFGFSSEGYRNFTLLVPESERSEYPELVPPRADEAMAKREFAKRYSSWKRALHQWDEKGLSSELQEKLNLIKLIENVRSNLIFDNTEFCNGDKKEITFYWKRLEKMLDFEEEKPSRQRVDVEDLKANLKLGDSKLKCTKNCI